MKDNNILDYIEKGHKNAVTRTELALITGYPDRKIRAMIQEAREREIIVNAGEGYFIPDLSDDIDICLTSAYINVENARANSIVKAIKTANLKLQEAGL